MKKEYKRMSVPQNTRYLDLDEQIIMRKALYKSSRIIHGKNTPLVHSSAELVERRIKDE